MDSALLLYRLDSNTQKKLGAFNLARLLLMSAVLITTIFLRQEVLGEWTIAQIYIVLAVSFFISLINISFWEETLRISYFMPSQLLYDILLTSYLVYLTGINDSIFLFLYLLNIVLSSVIYQLNGALIITGISGLLYAFIYYANVDTTLTSSWYNLVYNELLFLLTALLCGQLMDELKKQKILLAEQKESITRLELLNDKLLNSLPLGILVIDQQEYVEKINAPALKLLTLDHAPQMRLKYYELLPGLRGILQNWEKMSEKQKLRFRFKYQDKVESYFSVQVVKLPESGANEKERKNSHIIAFQDVSKLLELEKKLDFESKLAATGQLAAGIAHEIRNPLASISGAIESLTSHLEITDAQDKKLVDISLREIKRLNHLITDFLEFAKPRDNTIEATPLKIAVQEVMDAVLNQNKNDIDIRFQISVSDNIFVSVNKERLKQVFFNLFLNSIDAAKNKQINISIKTRFHDDNLIELDVLDDGNGIPPNIANRIFDPFFTTKQTGTGLGLATVAQIVKTFKGEIHLGSNSNGALFIVRLPLDADSMQINDTTQDKI